MTKTKKIAIALADVAGRVFASAAAQAQDYKIGYITDLSGPLAGSYTPTWQGFELYMKALNDRGGVNGRKIAVTIDDDGLRADRAVAAAKKQVESNEVLGIFGLSLSSTQAPVLGEMQKVGVPVVSTFSAILDALPPAKPFYYSTGVMFEVAGEAIGVLQKQIASNGKVVGMTFDSVGGRAAIAHNKLTVEKEGYSWDEVLFPVRTADFTPFAQSAADMKPAMVVGHYGAEQNIGVIAALRAAGYTGPYVIAAYGASEDTVKQAVPKPAAATTSISCPALHAYRQRAGHDRHQPPRKVRHRQSEQHACHRLGARHVHRGGAEEMRGQLHTRASLDKAIQGIKIDTQGPHRRTHRNSAGNHYGTDLLAAVSLGEGQAGRRRRLAQARSLSTFPAK